MRYQVQARLVLPFLLLGTMSACQGSTADTGGAPGGQSTAALEASLPDADDASSSTGLLGWVKSEIVSMIGTFSATNGDTYYKTPAAAYAQIQSQLAAGGIADPNDALFLTSVGKIKIPAFDWDHSEFLIRGAVSLVDGHYVALDLRTVGDPWGAGMFDSHITNAFGPQLCLSGGVSMQTAIAASYLAGTYALDYVCHTGTLTVLESINVAPEYYEPNIGGWKLARWGFGPLGSSGLDSNPANWEGTQMCAQFSDLINGQ